ESALFDSMQLTATARSMLTMLHARVLALSGNHNACRTAVTQADATFAERDPTDDPPWLCYYDEAEHHGSIGKALLPVAEACADPTLAAPRLETAVRLQTASYPRSRTFSRIR